MSVNLNTSRYFDNNFAKSSFTILCYQGSCRNNCFMADTWGIYSIRDGIIHPNAMEWMEHLNSWSLIISWSQVCMWTPASLLDLDMYCWSGPLLRRSEGGVGADEDPRPQQQPHQAHLLHPRPRRREHPQLVVLRTNQRWAPRLGQSQLTSLRSTMSVRPASSSCSLRLRLSTSRPPWFRRLPPRLRR